MRALSSNDALARVEFRHHFWRRLHEPWKDFAFTVYRLSTRELHVHRSQFGTHQVYEHLQQAPSMPAVTQIKTPCALSLAMNTTSHHNFISGQLGKTHSLSQETHRDFRLYLYTQPSSRSTAGLLFVRLVCPSPAAKPLQPATAHRAAWLAYSYMPPDSG
jgi:hypothetical protein